MIARAQLFALAVLVPASSLWAQEGYRHGYIRTVEPGVTLQRASEPSSEAALPNVPFLPGDRVWSDENGRLEVQFADGSVLRLDSRSKLDYISQDGGRRERVVLRLWSGALFLHYRDGRRSPEFTIETPEGVLDPTERGVYRLDVEPGEARIGVLDGEAVVDAERRVRASRGEGVVIREGAVVAGPERLDAYQADDAFARWDDALEQQLAYADGRREEWLPEEVSPYAGDFAAYGDWRSEPEYGYVWYPRVDTGWRPYTQGYWAYTPYGWTWVPNERWGWAAFHYGRWGYSDRGWYWIPGAGWGPAWVSWSIGGDYLGWCPLGFGDRPVFLRSHRARGVAVPRATAWSTSGFVPWTYIRRADIGQRDLARRRVASSEVPAAELHALPVGHVKLTRDLRLVQASGAQAQPQSAVPRNVRLKPTIGDTVPELATDPTTTIRRPIPRRHREPDEAGDRQGDDGDRARVSIPRAPRGAANPWTPSSAVPRERRAYGDDAERAGGARPRAEDDEAARAREGDHGDRDREIMRPIFGPLSRPRSDDGADKGGSDKGGYGRRREHEGARDGGRPSGASGGAARPAPPPPQSKPQGDRGSSRGSGGERARPKDHN